jgi:hypothetical protein
VGWNTEPGGSGDWYGGITSGHTSRIGLTADLTLYAQWATRIYQSQRHPGLDEDGNKACDMKTNDKSLSDLTSLHVGLATMAVTYDLSGAGYLKAHASGLATIFSIGDSAMMDVAHEMFDRFFSGVGGSYRNRTLTNRVVGHQSTQRFFDDVTREFTDFLRRNNGNPVGAINDGIMRTALNGTRPTFNTNADLLNGLTITIHDTWGNYIDLLDYQFDGTTFSGTLRITIYDHFGLDDEDVTLGYDGLKQTLVSNYPGFQAWYVLQRYVGCGGKYKPFITYIETDIEFSGTI